MVFTLPESGRPSRLLFVLERALGLAVRATEFTSGASARVRRSTLRPRESKDLRSVARLDKFIPVTMAEGPHPFPFRTRPLSPPAPMVLSGQPGGRVGRCRDFLHSTSPKPRSNRTGAFLLHGDSGCARRGLTPGSARGVRRVRAARLEQRQPPGTGTLGRC
jgi:hypothetical protein